MTYKGVCLGAHRVCFQLVTGVSLTSDVFVCHKCDNPSCVNPDHLFAGSNSDNMLDCVRKGRHKHGYTRTMKRGEDNIQAKLNPAKVMAIRADRSPIKAIARAYSIDPKTVRMVKNREIWAHVP